MASRAILWNFFEQNSELKTTHNIFRDCRVHYFRQPFSKQLYVPPFISQIPDFIYCTVLIFILIYFEWRDTENQQYRKSHSLFNAFEFLNKTCGKCNNNWMKKEKKRNDKA